MEANHDAGVDGEEEEELVSVAPLVSFVGVPEEDKRGCRSFVSWCISWCSDGQVDGGCSCCCWSSSKGDDDGVLDAAAREVAPTKGNDDDDEDAMILGKRVPPPPRKRSNRVLDDKSDEDDCKGDMRVKPQAEEDWNQSAPQIKPTVQEQQRRG